MANTDMWRVTGVTAFRDLNSCPYGVYRVYGACERLLYIGMSCDPDARMARGHRFTARWADEYDHHRITWYDNRRDAKIAETRAIESEHPAHNKAHNQAGRL